MHTVSHNSHTTTMGTGNICVLLSWVPHGHGSSLPFCHACGYATATVALLCHPMPLKLWRDLGELGRIGMDWMLLRLAWKQGSWRREMQ